MFSLLQKGYNYVYSLQVIYMITESYIFRNTFNKENELNHILPENGNI